MVSLVIRLLMKQLEVCIKQRQTYFTTVIILVIFILKALESRLSPSFGLEVVFKCLGCLPLSFVDECVFRGIDSRVK